MGSLATQLRQGLAGKDTKSPAAVLDFDFSVSKSQTDVKMTVGGDNHNADDNDNVNDDVGASGRQTSQDADSAAVDICSTAPVHS